MSGTKSAQLLKTLGDEAWKRSEKINAELFNFMYGSLVVQIVKDYEDPISVNQQLEKIGFSMGTRLIEDFLSKSGISDLGSKCAEMKECAEVLSKVAFKMFLNSTPTVTNWNQDGTEFSLICDEAIFGGNLEIPDYLSKGGLQYHSLLAGIIKGALEMIQIKIDCSIVRCPLLHGAGPLEVRIKFLKLMEDEIPPADF